MDHVFRELMEGLKQTAEGLVTANRERQRVIDAALVAYEEHATVRERLEAVLAELVTLSRRVPPPPAS